MSRVEAPPASPVRHTIETGAHDRVMTGLLFIPVPAACNGTLRGRREDARYLAFGVIHHPEPGALSRRYCSALEL